MIPAAAPASNTAQGLARPISRATSEGKPKIPLPMIELMTRAARLHRPMARTSPDCSLPGKTWFYHSCRLSAISFQLEAVTNNAKSFGVFLEDLGIRDRRGFAED